MARFAIRLVMAAFGLSIAQGAALAQTKLLLSTFFPATHPIYADVLVPWAKSVEPATQGRVKIEFSASSLAPPPGQLDMVQRGIADVALQYTGVVPNRLQLELLTELPGPVSDSAQMSQALWNTHERHFRKRRSVQGSAPAGADRVPAAGAVLREGALFDNGAAPRREDRHDAGDRGTPVRGDHERGRRRPGGALLRDRVQGDRRRLRGRDADRRDQLQSGAQHPMRDADPGPAHSGIVCAGHERTQVEGDLRGRPGGDRAPVRRRVRDADGCDGSRPMSRRRRSWPTAASSSSTQAPNLRAN